MIYLSQFRKKIELDIFFRNMPGNGLINKTQFQNGDEEYLFIFEYINFLEC